MPTLLIDQGSESYLPNNAKMPYFDQGNTNACGTTSLAMTMTYLGVPRTRQEIDYAIRRSWKPDMYTAPSDIISFARDNGLRAQGFNNGRWQNVVNEIMLGNPCMCLVSADFEYPPGVGSRHLHGFHYVVVNGYRTGSKGSSLSVFHDPNVGTAGKDMEAVVSDFEAMWSNVGWGFHNYFIVFATKYGFFATISDRSLSGAEGSAGTLKGVADLFNGIAHFGTFSLRSYLRGIGLVSAGVAETIVCGLSALVQLAGQKLNNGVDGIPVVRNLAQPVGDMLNAGGAVTSDLAQAAGDVTDDSGRFLGSLLSGNFGGAGQALIDSFGDTSAGIVKSSNDALDGLGDSVKDLFQSLFSDPAPSTGAGGVGPSPTGPSPAQRVQ